MRSRSSYRLAATVIVLGVVTAGTALAVLPAPVTLSGVGGARIGMAVSRVEAAWDVDLALQRPGGLDCATASIRRGSLRGYALFTSQRLRSVWFTRGAHTGRGIRIGSTLEQLHAAYPAGLTSRPDKYTRHARNWFYRPDGTGAAGLRFDVSPAGLVTLIAYGDRTLELVEGCA